GSGGGRKRSAGTPGPCQYRTVPAGTNSSSAVTIASSARASQARASRLFTARSPRSGQAEGLVDHSDEGRIEEDEEQQIGEPPACEGGQRTGPAEAMQRAERLGHRD